METTRKYHAYCIAECLYSELDNIIVNREELFIYLGEIEYQEHYDLVKYYFGMRKPSMFTFPSGKSLTLEEFLKEELSFSELDDLEQKLHEKGITLFKKKEYFIPFPFRWWETVADYLIKKIHNSRSGYIFSAPVKRKFYDALLVLWFILFNPFAVMLYATLGLMMLFLFCTNEPN